MRNQHAKKKHHASRHGESACTVQIVRVHGRSSQPLALSVALAFAATVIRLPRRKTCHELQSHKCQLPPDTWHRGVGACFAIAIAGGSLGLWPRGEVSSPRHSHDVGFGKAKQVRHSSWGYAALLTMHLKGVL